MKNSNTNTNSPKPLTMDIGKQADLLKFYETLEDSELAFFMMNASDKIAAGNRSSELVDGLELMKAEFRCRGHNPATLGIK